ncbi:hypothetical protein F4680DRAFT_422823 [Xylaria scruposa]|nr:hypothetical protein F4680DRAFT_422823 [Xylaria scruposa]
MVLSLVAARNVNMTEEAIRFQAKASMSQAALRLANEAQARFRADLQAELDKIDRETEKKLETLRRQQREGNASEQNGNSRPGDGGIASMLLGANADILIVSPLESLTRPFDTSWKCELPRWAYSAPNAPASS